MLLILEGGRRPATSSPPILEVLRETGIVSGFSMADLKEEVGDDSTPGLAEALRRIRPAVERLLIANKVPSSDAYELLLAALRNVPEGLDGPQLDRRLLQEVHRGLSGWRDQARVWKEQAITWVDLLVTAGLIPKTDRSTWLRTLGAPKR